MKPGRVGKREVSLFPLLLILPWLLKRKPFKICCGDTFSRSGRDTFYGE
jgi:hypothetical protein